MKRTDKAELRAKPATDLTKMANDLREQLLRGRIAGAVEGKGLGAKARHIRRQIARIETFIAEQRAQSQKVKA